MERPIGFPEALHVLWSWKGQRVEVTVSNQLGRKLTSVSDVLADHSMGTDRVEFGIEEPGNPSATVPVALDEPYDCTLGDGTVTVATARGIVVLFAYAEQEAN
jgi:hypothetical protein